jgi:hypothetical protein
MNNLSWMPNKSKPDLLGKRLGELRSQLQDQNPEQLAIKTGTRYHQLDQSSGEFHITLWDRQLVIKFPELVAHDQQSGEEISGSSLAMLLYYYATCDGTKPSGQWISFSELPDGRFYNQAYQGYTGGKLGQVFGNDFDIFCQVAENMNGKRVYLLGDAAYEFYVLPLVSLLLVTWQGDEDFNASYQVLFDAVISHQLPTDASAVIGSNLTHRLIVEMESVNENRD